jgi:hypothetical protein
MYRRDSLPTERFAVMAHTPLGSRRFAGVVGEYVLLQELSHFAILIQTGELDDETSRINVRLRVRTEAQQVAGTHSLYYAFDGADASSRGGSLLMRSNSVYVLSVDSSLTVPAGVFTNPTFLTSNRNVRRTAFTRATYIFSTAAGVPEGVFSTTLLGIPKTRPATLYNIPAAEVIS